MLFDLWVIVQLIFLCSKEKPNDADVFRLLGEVKYELKDYEGSVAAYKSSAMVSLFNIFKHFSLVDVLIDYPIKMLTAYF